MLQERKKPRMLKKRQDQRRSRKGPAKAGLSVSGADNQPALSFDLVDKAAHDLATRNKLRGVTVTVVPPEDRLSTKALEQAGKEGAWSEIYSTHHSLPRQWKLKKATPCQKW